MSKYLDKDGLIYLWSKIKALLANKVDVVAGKGLSTNDFTDTLKNKLDGLSNYTLPTASSSTKGGIKVGNGLSISSEVLSANAMGGASASGAGSAGMVPAPAAGNNTAFLRGDGTWATPTNTDTKVNVKLATTTKAYLLGTSTTPSSSNQAVEALSDTGVYLDTTAGKLTATSFDGDGSELTGLNGSNISSGTVAAGRIANLAASKITSGTFDAARIPDLSASKITSGTLDAARLPAMGGASSSAAGTAGAVPAPASGDQEKFLRGDGTWVAASVEDTKVNVTLSTTSKAYLLGVTDTPTSTATARSAVADTGVYLDTTAGKLTATSFAGNGSGLTSLNASNLGSGTVPAARLPAASASAAGAMSAADYSKLAAFGAASTYALKTDITNMYKHKGSVATESALPSTGNTAGDVYNVTATGMNFVWTGDAWDALGEIFSIDSITNAEIDTILAA